MTSLCSTCRVRENNFCAAVAGTADETPTQDAAWRVHEQARPNQIICRRGEPCTDAYVLCLGWALRYVQLPDGRRQILSILLPGDLFSVATVFEREFRFSVVALTQVQYCRMSQQHIRARAAAAAGVWDTMATICVTEKVEADNHTVDLGRRSAEERIAHLLLDVIGRLREREIIRDEHFVIPLRLRHIADFTGLTPVHVSRVLTKFRRERVVDLSGRRLRVLSFPALERLGGLK